MKTRLSFFLSKSTLLLCLAAVPQMVYGVHKRLYFSPTQCPAELDGIQHDDGLDISEVPTPKDSKNYSGPLSIPINKMNLSGESLMAESNFSKLLQTDLELMKTIYTEMPSSLNGKVLDIDLARKLFPPFGDGNEGASLYTLATHVPSSQFINYLFNADISDLAKKYRNPRVLFLAGGGGSGKGTVAGLYPDIYENQNLVLDGTLSSYEKAQARIDNAIKHGFSVTVVYVFTPVDLAVPQIVSRGMRAGRGVPIVVAAGDHFGAQKTVLRLSELFGKAITIRIFTNAGTKKDIKEEMHPEEFLHRDGVAYTSEKETVARAVKSYLAYIKTVKVSPELRKVFEKDMNMNEH